MRPIRIASSLVVSAFAVCGCTALLGSFEIAGEIGPGGEDGGPDGGSDVAQADVTSPVDAADAADALPPPPSGTVLLAKSFGGTKEDQVSATAVDPKGDIILAGAFYSPELDFGCAVRANSTPSPSGGPNRDSYVVKLDPSGACKWVVPLTGTGDDQISGVSVAPNGDVFIAGSTSSSPALLGTTSIPAPPTVFNVYQGYFARLDAATGSVAYVRRFGGPGGAFGADVSVSGSGMVVVGASWVKSAAAESIVFPGSSGGGITIPSPNVAQQYGVAVVYSPAGEPQWGRIFKASGNGSSVSVFKVIADPKDDILVAGTFSSASGIDPVGFPGASSPVTPKNPIGGSAVFYMKVAGTGTKGAPVWTKAWASDNDIEPQAIAVDPMGNNAITFSTFGRQDFGGGDQSFAGNIDIAVGGYGSGGNYGFGNLYGTADSDFPGGIALGPTGNRFLTGGFGGVLDLGGGNLAHAGGNDVFVASFDKTDKYRWAVSYGSSGTDSGRAMALGRSGLVVGAVFGGKINVGAQVFDTKGTDDILLLLLQP